MSISTVREILAPRLRAFGAWSRKALVEATTIHATGFADRVVERALKIQIGFLLFLALVAPFGGFQLNPWLAVVVLAQAALTWLALVRVRARDPFLGGGLYMGLAAVTFNEAKRYSGLVRAGFALEAVLGIIAAYYIVVLIRRHRAAQRNAQARTPRREAEAAA